MNNNVEWSRNEGSGRHLGWSGGGRGCGIQHGMGGRGHLSQHAGPCRGLEDDFTDLRALGVAASPETQGGRGMGGRGMGGRGNCGGRGGRMFGPGDLRLVLLALIEERPRHGYELIKDLEQIFGGSYSPSPGSIYPTLTLLEELAYVTSAQSEGTKRLFTITDAGAQYLRDNDAALRGAKARMELAASAAAGDAPPVDLQQAMQTLRVALTLHRGGWDAPETERVRKIIEDAAKEIAASSPRT